MIGVWPECSNVGVERLARKTRQSRNGFLSNATGPLSTVDGGNPATKTHDLFWMTEVVPVSNSLFPAAVTVYLAFSRCRICCLSFSGRRRLRSSFSGFCVFGFTEFRVSRCAAFWVFGFLRFGVAVFSAFWVFRFLGFGVPGIWGF